jgi:hypothetical protein
MLIKSFIIIEEKLLCDTLTAQSPESWSNSLRYNFCQTPVTFHGRCVIVVHYFQVLGPRMELSDETEQ